MEFVSFEGFGPADAILALTGNEVPRITVSNVYNRIAITAASREIYNINTEELRKVAENFIPEGGFSIIKKGVSIISYFFNIYFPDIKNNKDEVICYFRSLDLLHSLRCFQSIPFSQHKICHCGRSSSPFL